MASLLHTFSDFARLLDRTTCGTIRNVHACEFERTRAIVPAAGIELRGMIRKGEQVPAQKCFEPSAH
jgi:hypothetical protein